MKLIRLEQLLLHKDGDWDTNSYMGGIVVPSSTADDVTIYGDTVIELMMLMMSSDHVIH